MQLHREQFGPEGGIVAQQHNAGFHLRIKLQATGVAHVAQDGAHLRPDAHGHAGRKTMVEQESQFAHVEHVEQGQRDRADEQPLVGHGRSRF